MIRPIDILLDTNLRYGAQLSYNRESDSSGEMNMAATTLVRARVDEGLKEEAAEILATMGLTVSDFVRIGLTRVVHEKGLPFDMHVPNRRTAETLAKSERGEDLHRFDSADELFRDLGI